MVQTIDGASFRRMILSAAASVELQKQRINELNVFPVPDGDTGTNMSMTLQTASSDLRKAGDVTLSKAASITSSALLRGARGNSGVILSLLFRGFTKVLKTKEECDGLLFAQSLQDGVDAAYKAVMRPAEGTILTVSRVTAAALLEEAAQEAAIEHILECAVEHCRNALAETTNQNPVLKKANVVDAGGQGFLAILEGMLACVQGNDIVANVSDDSEAESVFTEFSTEDITFAYDTVYTMRKRGDISLDPLRAYLSSIGDSLVIGEDDDTFKVHVHTNTPGIALTESEKYGTLELAKIENMRTQHDELAAGKTAQSTDDLVAIEEELEASGERKAMGFVTVCAGDGLAAVFRDLGADAIVSGGQTMNPSTEDILRQISAVNADTVFVLPNNKNIIMAAQQAAALTEDRTVVVIPSKTVPQGITAMLNFDPDADAVTNEVTMTDALETVSTMQITYAARSSDFDGRDIHEGDYLALYDGALLDTGADLHALARQLADKTAETGREFITIYYGADVTEDRAKELAAVFAECNPAAELQVVFGGQPVYYYLISAE